MKDITEDVVRKFSDFALIGIIASTVASIPETYFQLVSGNLFIQVRQWPLLPFGFVDNEGLSLIVLASMLLSLLLYLGMGSRGLTLACFTAAKIWLYSLISSQGWVSHFGHIEGAFLLALTFGELGNASKARDTAMRLFLLYFLVSYGVNGIGKLIFWALRDFNLADVGFQLHFNLKRLHREIPWWLQDMQTWGGLTIFISLLEALALLSLIADKQRLRYWVSAMCVAHVLMIAVTRIFFTGNVIVLLALAHALRSPTNENKSVPPGSSDAVGL